MSENNEGKECPPKQGFISRLLNPPKCSMLQMIVIGVFGGIIIWGASTWAWNTRTTRSSVRPATR